MPAEAAALGQGIASRDDDGRDLPFKRRKAQRVNGRRPQLMGCCRPLSSFAVVAQI
jgi:hypothetical protein